MSIGFVQPKKTCESCHARLKLDALFCPRCGQHVFPKQTPYCFRCMRVAEAGDNFCSFCGFSLIAFSHAAPVPTSSNVPARLVLRKVRLVSWEVPHGFDK